MFQAVASLFLFGTLSSAGISPLELPTHLLDVASLPSAVPSLHAGDVSASGVLVLDLESGKELFAHGAEQRLSVASLAKLMTFDVIAKHHDIDEVVVVPSSAMNVTGNRAGLRSGERYTVGDLLGMILIASANDAAHTLALYHSGSIDDFVISMNERVEELGLRDTHFENPIGFDDKKQYSTARDIAWLARYSWKNPLVRFYAKKRQYTVWDRSGNRELTLYNTNQLLFSHPYAFSGLKTGTTRKAGECLISLATIKDRSYIFVVLRSNDRYRDTLSLFESLSQPRA